MVFHCSGDSIGQPALHLMEQSVNAWKENEMEWNGKYSYYTRLCTILSQSKMKGHKVELGGEFQYNSQETSYTGSNIIIALYCTVPATCCSGGKRSGLL